MFIGEKQEEILNDNYFFLLPKAPDPVFAKGAEKKDRVVTYLYDFFTVQAFLAGVPAISLPVGNNTKGLPLGLQLLTKHFNEQQLLDFSEYFHKL